MLIPACITILIISILQVFLLHLAYNTNGLKRIASREAMRYLMVVPVFFSFVLLMEQILEREFIRVCLAGIVFAWSSYYLSFGMKLRTVVPIANFIVASVLLFSIYVFYSPVI